MTHPPYLVALALVELNGSRRLPLMGKSKPNDAPDEDDPGALGRELTLDLLLRLWQRSDEGAVQRCAGDDSLLILELPLDILTEQLPVLKAQWISGGDTQVMLQDLRQLRQRGWRISTAKHEGTGYIPW